MRLFYCLLPFSVVAQAFIDPSLSSCPVSCQNVTNGWTHYHDIQDLQACEQPIIFDFNLYNTINDSASQVIFRACSSSSSTTKQAPQKRQQLSFDTEPKGAAGSLATQPESRHLDRLLWAVDTTAHTSGNLSSITNALLDYLQLEDQYPTGEPTILFARSGSTIIGAYAGAQIAKNSFSDIIREFGQAFEGESNDVAVQSCQENSTSTNLIGLFATTTGDLTKVQEAVRGWNDAKCITSASSKSAWKDFSVVIIPGVSISISPDNKDGQIHARSTCKYTQVQSGDGCWALAQRCAISQDDLKKYNRAGICTSPNPIVGEYVCCSTGTVPDFSPKPNPDGSCKTYSIKQNDLCSNIASANSITVDMINDRNKMTWGWTGCSSLVVGASICVSTGSPPMPAAVQNAVCGPQVPGTKKPSDMSHIEKLNPCPLNACCNIWGQCGITKDFCVQSASSTGAPGTAKPGSNGCISSCGTNITNNADKVASFMRVGYFEAWNADRKCLHMRPYQIDTSHYTHVHFAFGNITHDYTVDISGLKDMFNEFKTLTNVKKILSFGGWSFSTDFDTAPIFRKGVTSAQRQLFATNVAKFIVDNGLDGVDFDWEYPGAPDIPGLPPGDPQDGANYVEFLGLLRAALPTKYSVSLAAPASFWYLRGFPLDKMHQYLDYIIYMTYDLHGQWDYGHQWASPGCPAGNCLRSHVNQTEVNDALVMITKAGVPAKKVIVGMPMYGRSFKMTKAGCWGPDCTYIGADSAAAPGRCTDTRGYISNFEIREIIKKGGVEQHHSDDGDILIYNSLEWVSWMNTDSYQKRLDWVKGLNFGGTSDWAIDLDENYAVNDGPGKGDDGTIGKGDSGSAGNVIISPDIFSQKGDAQVSCQPPCNFVFPPWILDQPTTISPPKATVTYFENWSTTITVSGAAITTTASSVTTTVISIPPITTKTISVWNHSWNGTNATIWLTASVPIPPLTLTRTSTSSSDFVRPVITWTYSPGPYPSLQTTNPGQPDPTPPGPPPPPPPGFAPTVKVTHAAPGPTCKPGQPCGKPCLLNCNPRDTGCIGICGCIGPLCPGKSCIGSGCLAASGQPSGCDSVTTVSDCLVECSVVKRPTTTYTRCNDPECTRTAAGCDTSGTTKTTTTTNMCAALPSITAFTTVAEIGEGGAGGWVIETGDFGTMPDDGPTTSRTGVQTCPPPQVTVPPLPTITNLGDDKSCDKCSSGQNVRKFQRTDAEKAFSSVCDGTRTFSTADGIATGIPVSKDVTINIDVNRMTGPNCKDAKPFVMGDYCTKALEAVFTCDDDDTGSYGAAFVHNGDYGCVLWAAYA